MGLYYHTDFSFGRRGRHIRRTYTGVPAFLAIVVDLFFMLTLELTLAALFLALRLAWRLVVAVTYLLTFPFRAARWVSARLEARYGRSSAVPAFKPAWQGFSDI